uniref:Uncharacterized protein n=1 Tax=Burkholderia pseudomallei TaxID=28450 RepID=A0A0C5AYA4_BURPE|nr:hypothetical protein pBPS036 [Burkholderia pseudomallei]
MWSHPVPRAAYPVIRPLARELERDGVPFEHTPRSDAACGRIRALAARRFCPRATCRHRRQSPEFAVPFRDRSPPPRPGKGSLRRVLARSVLACGCAPLRPAGTPLPARGYSLLSRRDDELRGLAAARKQLPIGQKQPLRRDSESWVPVGLNPLNRMERI